MQIKTAQSTTGLQPTVHWLEFHKDEGLLRSRKLSAALDIVICLLIPIILYSVANIVMLDVKCPPWESTLWLLLAYVIMLFLVAISVLRHKNKCIDKSGSEFVLSSDEIACLFNYILFINALYFFIWGFNEGHEGAKVMGATNATLFVGFAISLSGLFQIQKYRHIYRSFLQPFVDIKNVIGTVSALIGVVVTLLLAFCGSNPWYVAVPIVLMMVVLFFLNMRRKTSKELFAKRIKSLILGKRILILQLGPDYIVGKTIENLFIQNGLVITPLSQEKADTYKYDIVIVLNSLFQKKVYLPYLDLIKNYLAVNGKIIDPFVTRRFRRSFVRAWMGMANRKPEPFSIDQYNRIICNVRKEKNMKKSRKFPWTLLLVVTVLIVVASPIATYLIALLCKDTTAIPHLGSVDAWIDFSGSIIGGSLTMLALAFTIHHERKVAEENERQNIRPTLFCKIKNELLADEYGQFSLPDCVNNYGFIRWEMSNVSTNVADHIRIVDQQTYIRNENSDEEIDGNLLLENQGISIMTVLIQDHISLEPNGSAMFQTNFGLETLEDGTFKTGNAFDFVYAITIEYTDVKGIGVYKSKFTIHLNINIDVENKPCVFIESTSNTLLEQ